MTKIRYCLGPACTRDKGNEEELKEVLNKFIEDNSKLDLSLIEMPCLSVCMRGPIFVLQNDEERGKNRWYCEIEVDELADFLTRLAKHEMIEEKLLGIGVHPKSPFFDTRVN